MDSLPGRAFDHVVDCRHNNQPPGAGIEVKRNIAVIRHPHVFQVDDPAFVQYPDKWFTFIKFFVSGNDRVKFFCFIEGGINGRNNPAVDREQMGNKGDKEFFTRKLRKGLLNFRSMPMRRNFIGGKRLVAVGVMGGLGMPPPSPGDAGFAVYDNAVRVD